MKTIHVTLGTAPNGEKVWGISYESNLTKDNTIGTSVEIKHLNTILPTTLTNEEYFLEVAKYACNMLEEKLINKDDIYNSEFICNGITYRKTK